MSYMEGYAASVEDHYGEDLTQQFVSWTKPGDMVVGKFLMVETVTPKEGMGPVNRYVLDTDDGVVSCLLGSATDKQLDGKLEPGDLISIVFHGKIPLKDGNKQVNKFEVKRFGHEDVE